jgi:hypothetical protein
LEWFKRSKELIKTTKKLLDEIWNKILN